MLLYERTLVGVYCIYVDQNAALLKKIARNLLLTLITTVSDEEDRMPRLVLPNADAISGVGGVSRSSKQIT